MLLWGKPYPSCARACLRLQCAEVNVAAHRQTSTISLRWLELQQSSASTPAGQHVVDIVMVGEHL